MHSCIRINMSFKQFLKSSFVRLSMTCSKAVSSSLLSLNRIPRNYFFSFGNKKKSQILKSGEYAGFWYCSTWFSSKNSLVIQARCGFALSWWKMRPGRPRVSPRSETAEKTFGKHVLTYQLAFTVAPVSNGTGLIKADFMKKTATILVPPLLFRWTLLGRWSVVGRQTFHYSFSSGS